MKTRDDPYYLLWHCIRLRYFRPRSQGYKRRVHVHPNWLKDYQVFRVELLAEIGEKPGRGWTLDRIDNARGYEPKNVRWATRQMQSRNRGSYNKLNETKAMEIRALYKAGGVSQERLATVYNITQAHVSQIVRGVAWK